jgi:hypothetical protein
VDAETGYAVTIPRSFITYVNPEAEVRKHEWSRKLGRYLWGDDATSRAGSGGVVSAASFTFLIAAWTRVIQITLKNFKNTLRGLD